MHAITMLHRLLSKSCPHIHQKRLDCFCAVTGAAVSGSALTLSDLGRGLAGRVSMKHNINPVPCRLVIVKRLRKGRHQRSVLGKPVRSHHSRKNARCQREPWLLAASPELEHLSANTVVNVYARRMQIEEEFRDLKNEHLGLGLAANRSRHGERLGVPLLIACLASFLLRLIGEIGCMRHAERQCQSNTRRVRAVLSVINLARQLARKGQVVFPFYELMAALRHLRRGFMQEI